MAIRLTDTKTRAKRAKKTAKATKKVVKKAAKTRSKAKPKPVKKTKTAKKVVKKTKTAKKAPVKRAKPAASKAKAILAKAAAREAAKKAALAAKKKAEAAALRSLLKAEREKTATAAKAAVKQASKVLTPSAAARKLASLHKQLGSSALATLLHKSPATLRKWLAEGVSAQGLKEVTRVAKERVKTVSEGKKELANFNQLLKYAGENELIPKTRTGEKARSGRNTIGHSWIKSWQLGLTLELIDEITAWLGSHKKRSGEFIWWHCVAAISQYGKADSEKQGYKTVFVQIPTPKGGDFLIEEVIATHRAKQLRTVSDEMRAHLEGMLTSNVLAVVHDVSLFNYRERTDKQKSEYESRSRRKREAYTKKHGRKGKKS